MKKNLYILILLLPLQITAQKIQPNFIDSVIFFIAIDDKIVSSKDVKEFYWTYYDSLNNMYHINCQYKIGKLLIDKRWKEIYKSNIAKWSKFTILYQNKNNHDSVYVYETEEIYLRFSPYINFVNEKNGNYYYCYQDYGWMNRYGKSKKNIILPPNFYGWIPNNISEYFNNN